MLILPQKRVRREVTSSTAKLVGCPFSGIRTACKKQALKDTRFLCSWVSALGRFSPSACLNAKPQSRNHEDSES